MRTSSLLFGILLGAVCTALFVQFLAEPPRAADPPGVADADDDNEIPSRLRRVDGETVVVLNAAERRMAELVTARPTQVAVESFDTNVGRVADTGRYLVDARAVISARDAANARRTVVAALAERLAKLRRLVANGEITAARELAALEIQARREGAAAADREAAVAAAEGALVARWGTALAAAPRGGAGWFSALGAGEAQLVEFGAAVAPPASIEVSPSPAQAGLPGEIVGAAPDILGSAQLPTYFAVTRDARLRTGMQVFCRVPRDAPATSGWLVPSAALVWQGGAPWFYVETAPGEFRRKAAADALPHADGRIVIAGLADDDAVVVRGAQALLAEEFRSGIPVEDDD